MNRLVEFGLALSAALETISVDALQSEFPSKCLWCEF